jgi:hypothetical protein
MSVPTLRKEEDPVATPIANLVFIPPVEEDPVATPTLPP